MNLPIHLFPIDFDNSPFDHHLFKNPNNSYFAPRIEVKDNEESYLITVELPGIKKQNIHVTLQSGILSIIAEHSQEDRQETNGKVIHQERYYGKFIRHFNVCISAKQSDISAQLYDGILKVKAPKRKSESKEIFDIPITDKISVFSDHLATLRANRKAIPIELLCIDNFSNLTSEIEEDYDILKLQLHLMNMDMKDEWASLDQKLHTLKSTINEATHPIEDSTHDIFIKLNFMANELKEGYCNLKSKIHPSETESK